MAYEWPPLTPGDTDEVAQRVAAVLEEAWQRLEARQQTVIATMENNPRATHILATLEEFKQAITEFRNRADAEVRAFVQRQLPWLYQQGAQAAADAIGSPFTWTQIHKDALQTLASDSYADLLRRSQEAGRMAEQFYRAARSAARIELPLLAAVGTTDRQAAKDLANRLLADHQLAYVVYPTAPASLSGSGRRRQLPHPHRPRQGERHRANCGRRRWRSDLSSPLPEGLR
jgi:hypothetical protein